MALQTAPVAPERELRPIPLAYGWAPSPSIQAGDTVSVTQHFDGATPTAPLVARDERFSSPPRSPAPPAAFMSPSVYEYSPGDLENKLMRFSAGNNWFASFQESQAAEQTPLKTGRPRQLFGTPSPLTSPGITSPTKLSTGKPSSAKKSAKSANKKRSRMDALAGLSGAPNLVEDPQMEPRSPTKRPFVEVIQLDSSISEVGETSLHERDVSYLASPDRSVEIHLDLPPQSARKHFSSSVNTSMNEEDSRDDENNRSLALSDVPLPATLPLSGSLQATLPLSYDPAATLPLSPVPPGSSATQATPAMSPSLAATLPLSADSPYLYSPTATLPLPSSDVPSTLPATLPLPASNGVDLPPSPSPSPPSSPSTFSQLPSQPMDTQGLSKVATQATYDEDAFLAQFSSQFAKAKKVPPPMPKTAPIAPIEAIESSQDDFDDLKAIPSSLAQSSTTLKSVLFQPQQPSFVDSLLQSASRSVTKKKNFYSVRPTDSSRYQPERSTRSFSGGNWTSASYSLVDSTVTDFMVDSDTNDVTEENTNGVLTYDPDFEPIGGRRPHSPGFVGDMAGYTSYDGQDPENDFMTFGLNSQLPTQAPIRRKGNDRRATQQPNILMEIDDSEPQPLVQHSEDPIDDIVSSQESVHMSVRGNPVDYEDELIRDHYTPLPSQSLYQAPMASQSMHATQMDASQSLRNRFMPPPSATQSQAPMASQLAYSQSQASGSTFRGSFQPAKRGTASKASKKVKKRHIAERKFQRGLVAPDDIEEENVFLAPQPINKSVYEGSVFDADRSEAIEEFSAAEVRASTAAVAYEPYKLVAKAASSSDTISVSETTGTTPVKQVAIPQRQFVLPGSLPSTSLQPTIGSEAWLSKVALPDWPSADPLARLAAEGGTVFELGALKRQVQVACLVLLTSSAPLEGHHVTSLVQVLMEGGMVTPSLALLVCRPSANLVVGNVIRCSDADVHAYGDGISIQWPFHKLPPSISSPKKDMSNISAPIIIFGRESTTLSNPEAALLVSGQTGVREVRDRFASAVTATPPPSSFGAITPPPSSSLQIRPRNPLPEAHSPTSRPFILPNALSAPALPQTSATVFSRQRPLSTVHLYQNALGFVGHAPDAFQQVLILAVFARPVSMSSPSSKAASVTTASLLSTKHFRKNWSQAVANLEESARIKRNILHKRVAKPFSIASISSAHNVAPKRPLGSALALIKGTKSLVWIDYEFEDAVPGATWTLKTSRLRQLTSASSTNIHTLVRNAIDLFGVNSDEISKSYTAEPRSRLTVHVQPSGGDSYFPSSQESDMDVDHAQAAHQAPILVSHPVFSCCIPRVSIANKDCRTLGIARSSDDRLLQISPDETFTRPRRVSLVGLISSALELIPTKESRNPLSMCCSLAFKGLGDELASLLLPSYLLQTDPLSSPLAIDHLLQVSPNAFVADGFTQITSLVAVEGVPGVRSFERCSTPWEPRSLQCATGEMIKYKESGKSVRVPLASWKKKLLEHPALSSYDACTAGTLPSTPHLELHGLTCPERHSNLVLLPSTWNSELFAAVELPDRIGFCRSCFTTVTPVPAS